MLLMTTMAGAAPWRPDDGRYGVGSEIRQSLSYAIVDECVDGHF
jgi:hypothetical protein